MTFRHQSHSFRIFKQLRIIGMNTDNVSPIINQSTIVIQHNDQIGFFA